MKTIDTPTSEASDTETDNSTQPLTTSDTDNKTSDQPSVPSTQQTTNEDSAIARLNQRIDELERVNRERQQPIEIKSETEKQSDKAPTNGHFWFRRPFVAG